MPFLPGLLMENSSDQHIVKQWLWDRSLKLHFFFYTNTYKAPFPQLIGVSCCSGLFPDTEKMGERAEGTRPRGHCCSHSRKQEWFRRHQVSLLTQSWHQTHLKAKSESEPSELVVHDDETKGQVMPSPWLPLAVAWSSRLDLIANPFFSSTFNDGGFLSPTAAERWRQLITFVTCTSTGLTLPVGSFCALHWISFIPPNWRWH